ncbi:hypothetical protein NDU88_002488 [Pleurodeles waltl]|uniref:Uncharacterized protein n=1 Tax=Pleurodeles waltl TaxID=8319 RepID=A0AAV7LCN0_PLEWA|nr:hypothetical protein NDU88_002488 [Pleurodeles waltl]
MGPWVSLKHWLPEIAPTAENTGGRWGGLSYCNSPTLEDCPVTMACCGRRLAPSAVALCVLGRDWQQRRYPKEVFEALR